MRRTVIPTIVWPKHGRPDGTFEIIFGDEPTYKYRICNVTRTELKGLRELFHHHVTSEEVSLVRDFIDSAYAGLANHIERHIWDERAEEWSEIRAAPGVSCDPFGQQGEFGGAQMMRNETESSRISGFRTEAATLAPSQSYYPSDRKGRRSNRDRSESPAPTEDNPYSVASHSDQLVDSSRSRSRSRGPEAEAGGSENYFVKLPSDADLGDLVDKSRSRSGSSNNGMSRSGHFIAKGRTQELVDSDSGVSGGEIPMTGLTLGSGYSDEGEKSAKLYAEGERRQTKGKAKEVPRRRRENRGSSSEIEKEGPDATSQDLAANTVYLVEREDLADSDNESATYEGKGKGPATDRSTREKSSGSRGSRPSGEGHHRSGRKSKSRTTSSKHESSRVSNPVPSDDESKKGRSRPGRHRKHRVR